MQSVLSMVKVTYQTTMHMSCHDASQMRRVQTPCMDDQTVDQTVVHAKAMLP